MFIVLSPSNVVSARNDADCGTAADAGDGSAGGDGGDPIEISERAGDVEGSMFSTTCCGGELVDELPLSSSSHRTRLDGFLLAGIGERMITVCRFAVGAGLLNAEDGCLVAEEEEPCVGCGGGGLLFSNSLCISCVRVELLNSVESSALMQF